jgi:hypothetical protein
MTAYRKILLGEHESVTGDPERDALICALRALELHDGEKRGWNQLPKLMALLLPELGARAVRVDPVPLRAWRGSGENPTGWLAQTARRQQVAPPSGHARPVKFADSPRGFAALAVMLEAWTISEKELTSDERARGRAGERVVTAHPQRVETRFILAVDINDNYYHLFRDRGQEPRLGTSDDPHDQVDGRGIQALRRLTAAVYAGVFTY